MKIWCCSLTHTLKHTHFCCCVFIGTNNGLPGSFLTFTLLGCLSACVWICHSAYLDNYWHLQSTVTSLCVCVCVCVVVLYIYDYILLSLQFWSSVCVTAPVWFLHLWSCSSDPQICVLLRVLLVICAAQPLIPPTPHITSRFYFQPFNPPATSHFLPSNFTVSAAVMCGCDTRMFIWCSQRGDRRTVNAICLLR